MWLCLGGGKLFKKRLCLAGQTIAPDMTVCRGTHLALVSSDYAQQTWRPFTPKPLPISEYLNLNPPQYFTDL